MKKKSTFIADMGIKWLSQYGTKVNNSPILCRVVYIPPGSQCLKYDYVTEWRRLVWLIYLNEDGTKIEYYPQVVADITRQYRSIYHRLTVQSLEDSNVMAALSRWNPQPLCSPLLHQPLQGPSWSGNILQQFMNCIYRQCVNGSWTILGPSITIKCWCYGMSLIRPWPQTRFINCLWMNYYCKIRDEK